MTAGPLRDDTSPGGPVASGGRAGSGRVDRIALALAALYLPFIFLGYGTDIDVANVRRSGESLLDGDYGVSRTPGSLPTEFLTGVLDAIGDAWLVNLASVAAALVTLLLLGRIVSREAGERSGVVAVLVLGCNPWFVVGATSLSDVVPAIGLVLLGLWLFPRHPWLAGLVYGLAIGTRMASVVVIGGLLLSTALDRDGRPDRSSFRTAFRTGVVAVVVGAVFFVPAWLQYDRTLDFLQNEFDSGSLVTMVGRWFVKNVAFFGIPVLVLLAFRARTVFEVLGQWRTSELARVAIVLTIAAEGIYLRLPFKIVHLLPMAVVVAVVVASSPRFGNRFVGALLAAQICLAVVAVTLAAPDVPDASTTGGFRPGLVWGVVVNDVRCRVDPPVDDAAPDQATVQGMDAAEAMFRCQARSWRAE